MAIPEIDKLIELYNAEWDAKRIPYAHKIDSIAVNSYHYALGWTSPYGARMLYWNKLNARMGEFIMLVVGKVQLVYGGLIHQKKKT